MILCKNGQHNQVSLVVLPLQELPQSVTKIPPTAGQRASQFAQPRGLCMRVTGFAPDSRKFSWVLSRTALLMVCLRTLQQRSSSGFPRWCATLFSHLRCLDQSGACAQWQRPACLGACCRVILVCRRRPRNSSIHSLLSSAVFEQLGIEKNSGLLIWLLCVFVGFADGSALYLAGT